MSAKPIRRQCECLRTCGEPDIRESQCPEPATTLLDDRSVCWVHLKAATNPNRGGMLRFIVRPDDCASEVAL